MIFLLIANFVFLFLSSPSTWPISAASAQDEAEPLDFNDTRWNITLIFFDKKGKKQIKTDTLVFENKMVLANGFKKKGFSPTNYSVSVREDGTTTFSTMQIAGKETAFWRGEIYPGKTSMNGQIHVTTADGEMQEYVLEGNLSSGDIKTKSEKESEAQLQSVQQPAQGQPQPGVRVEPQPRKAQELPVQ
jgi:hypothetical protein